MKKTLNVFRNVSVVTKCFWAFILPVLEFCSPVWMFAATSLLLLDRVVTYSVGKTTYSVGQKTEITLCMHEMLV